MSTTRCKIITTRCGLQDTSKTAFHTPSAVPAYITSGPQALFAEYRHAEPRLQDRTDKETLSNSTHPEVNCKCPHHLYLLVVYRRTELFYPNEELLIGLFSNK